VLIGIFGWTIDVEEPAAPTEKQRLRGWLHVVMFPIAILGGVAIVVFANSCETRLSFVVFALVAALLFGTSALLHRGTWTPRVEGVLRRTDHSNIYLIIAATYPPFAALAMPEGRGRVLLFIVLIALCGVLYNAGAGVYGTRWQNPSPEWFGFHEVFHALTVVVFAARWRFVGRLLLAPPCHGIDRRSLLSIGAFGSQELVEPFEMEHASSDLENDSPAQERSDQDEEAEDGGILDGRLECHHLDDVPGDQEIQPDEEPSTHVFLERDESGCPTEADPNGNRSENRDEDRRCNRDDRQDFDRVGDRLGDLKITEVEAFFECKQPRHGTSPGPSPVGRIPSQVRPAGPP
jgi:hemolysin III